MLTACKIFTRIYSGYWLMRPTCGGILSNLDAIALHNRDQLRDLIIAIPQ